MRFLVGDRVSLIDPMYGPLIGTVCRVDEKLAIVVECGPNSIRYPFHTKRQQELITEAFRVKEYR